MQHKVVYMYITLAEIPLFTLIDMDDERRGMEIKTVLQSFQLGKPAPKRTKKNEMDILAETKERNHFKHFNHFNVWKSVYGKSKLT